MNSLLGVMVISFEERILFKMPNSKSELLWQELIQGVICCRITCRLLSVDFFIDWQWASAWVIPTSIWTVIEQERVWDTCCIPFVLRYLRMEERKSGKGKCSFVALGRDEATRTPDPYVPNVVRYQLRYIPIAFLKASAKVRFLIDKW